MLTAVFMDVLPMVVSLVMGVITTHWKQTQKDLHEERLYALKATEAARSDQSRPTSASRKFIVHSVIGSLFLFPMLLTILNWLGPFFHALIFGDMPWIHWQPIMIYVPKDLETGGLLSLIWSKKELEYMPLTGFVLMPIHVILAQIIVGFYFGSSAMKR